MNKKLIFSAIAIVLLAVVGFLMFSFNQQTSPASLNGNPTSSPEASNPPEASASPSVKEDKEKEASKAKEEVSKIGTVDLKDVEPIEGFGDEEIQSATKFVSDYAVATHTNTYFLGGEWAKGGGKIDDFNSFFSPYYSKDLLDAFKKYEGKQGTEEFADELTTLVPFFDDNDFVRPSEDCKSPEASKEISNKVNTRDTNCVENFKISEIEFYPMEDKGDSFLVAKFEVTSDISLYSKELEAEGIVSTKYKYKLTLEPNVVSDKELEWKIIGYDISPFISSISKAKSQ